MLSALPSETGPGGRTSGASLVSSSGRLLEAKYPEPVTVHVDKTQTPRGLRKADKCVAKGYSCCFASILKLFSHSLF